MFAYEAYQWIFSIFTFGTNIGLKFLFSLGIMEPYNRVAISWEVFNIPHYIAPNHREGEIAVPYENCVNAVQELARVKRDLNIPVNHIVEVSKERRVVETIITSRCREYIIHELLTSKKNRQTIYHQ